MESIAYLVNRNFILVATDTNYETNFNGVGIKMNCAKKVHKLNDHNLISVIGNPYKTTDINKYILKLNELGHNSDYDQIITDLNDVFNSSRNEISKTLQELSVLLPKFVDESGNLKADELFEHLKDKPEYISLIKDTILSMNNSHPTLTQVLIFGWDKINMKSRLGHFVSIGQILSGGDINEMLPDFVYTRFASASIDTAVTSKLESEAVQGLSSVITVGWDNSSETINPVIEKAKEILREGLRKITPYQTEPNVIFYELSHRTNFVFNEPSINLKTINYNRDNS